jgi:serine/threonine-protein kinase
MSLPGGGHFLTELLEPGAKLERFTIVRRIGAGGMGVVYLAHDSRLSVNVALKVLSPPYAKEKFFARLRREVLLARKVSHPSICRIFDLHDVDGQHAISMEYIEGQTLDSFIRETGILPLDLAGRLGFDICAT